MIKFSVEKTLAEIGSTSRAAKRLCLVSWNGAPAKLDLRQWLTDDETGSEKPAKGITLTDDEARLLLDALQAYFNGE